MAKSILTNVRLFAVAADLTSATNTVELSTEVEDKDVTNYGSSGWTEVLGGLHKAEFSCEGFWEAGDAGQVDDASWAQLGGTGPWTVGPNGATVDSLAYLTKTLRSSYTLLGEVGEAAPWEGSGMSAWPLVRGQFVHNPGTARSSSGNGTGKQLGAVAAGQRLYGSLHILSASGVTPSITVEVESDVDNTFSTPTTRLSFTSASDVGGQILRTDGSAITDEWFRLTWTISGTSPSFLFTSALGVA